MITIAFSIACLVTTCLFIWFKTDALPEWGKLLFLKKFLDLESFRDAKIDAAPNLLTYPQFLKNKYNKQFWARLVGCPACLGLWLVIMAYVNAAIIFGSAWIICQFFIGYVFTIIMYGIMCKCYQMAQ